MIGNNTQNAAELYRMQQVNNASPLDLIILAYDAALIGCNNKDLARTTRALNELKNSLDPSYDAQIALGLHRLYTWCQDLARANNYDEAAKILRELRDTWLQVKQQYQPAAAMPAATGSSYASYGSPAPAVSAYSVGVYSVA